MVSLEQEIKDHFKPYLIIDNTSSYKDLDFQHNGMALDAKEKRQKYNTNNWNTDIPEEHLFIIDDLAARKVLLKAPKSGLIVRDNVTGKYYLFSVLDLFSMPKQRANRRIEKSSPALKGKWLIDLRNGFKADSLSTIFEAIDLYIHTMDASYSKLECHGDYHDEDIGVGGTTRTAGYWKTDYESTR